MLNRIGSNSRSLGGVLTSCDIAEQKCQGSLDKIRTGSGSDQPQDST